MHVPYKLTEVTQILMKTCVSTPMLIKVREGIVTWDQPRPL
jgi:hypothetical protein